MAKTLKKDYPAKKQVKVKRDEIRITNPDKKLIEYITGRATYEKRTFAAQAEFMLLKSMELQH